MNAEIADARGTSVWISSVNVIAGIWLIIAPFVLLYQRGTARVNDIVLGIVIGVFALIRALAPGAGTAWLSWLNALWGIWLIIGSFILGYAGAARTNDIILGIIVLVFGLWSQAETEQRQTTIVH
jgi:hypothetical protein